MWSALLWAVAVPSCLDPGVSRQDVVIPKIEVYDFLGHEVARNALPQWPRFRLSAVLSPPPADLHLLPEALSDDLLADLSRAPLTKARLRAHVPLAISRDEADTEISWLQPVQALLPGRHYTLAVPRTAETADLLRGHVPVAIEMQVLAAPAAGARLLASVPAAGEHTVAPELRAVWLAFSGRLSSCAGFQLHRVVPTQIEPPLALRSTATAIDCQLVDYRADTCCLVTLDEPLATATRYEIQPTDVQDAYGAPPVGTEVFFRTAERAQAAPLLIASDCEPFEHSVDGELCVRLSDRSVVLRVNAAAGLLTTVELGARTLRRLLPVGASTLTVSALHPLQTYTGSVAFSTAYGPVERRTFAFTTLAPLPPLHISEVLADPLGAEDRQEYVELNNASDGTVVARGLRLGPSATHANLLPELRVAAHARLLLVPSGYDATAPSEPTPPAGAPRVYLAEPLTGNGLNNRGEAIGLWDASGALISQSPAVMAGEGRCLHRRGDNCNRQADPDDFTIDDCSPGY